MDFDVKGLVRADMFVRRSMRNVQSDLLLDVADLIRAQSQRRIRFERREPSGALWARRKKRYPWPALFRTRKLHDSIEAVRRGSEGVAVEVGASYGVFHQYGTRHMTARPFIGLSRQNEAEIESEIQRWLNLAD